MLNFMDDYYVKMKEELGIDPNYAEEEDDPQLDIVLQKLRPNTTAKNFREFLTKSQNVNKTRAWKKVARKVHAQDEKAKAQSNAQQTTNQLMHNTSTKFFGNR